MDSPSPARSSGAAALRGRLTVAACVVAIIVAALAMAGWRARHTPELSARGDALYDAIVARNLLAGRGLTTNLMPLGGLKVLAGQELATADPWPSVHKFAGSQARVALFFAVLGETVTALRLASLVPYVALLVMLFLALRRRVGSTSFALAAVLVLLPSDAWIAVAISGQSITTDALLFAAIAVLWLRMLARPALAPLLGLLVGVSVLHRYSMVLFVPFCVVGVALTSGRRAAALVAGAVALVIVPFVAWSYARYHLPFPSYLGDALFLHRTDHLPNDPWYVDAWPSLGSVIRDDPGAFVDKLARNSAALAGTLLSPWTTGFRTLAVATLAVVGLLQLRRAAPRAFRVAATLAAFTGCFAAFHMLMTPSLAYHFYAMPVAWMGAAYGLAHLARRWSDASAARPAPRPRWQAGVAAAALAVALVVPELVRAHRVAAADDVRPRPCPIDAVCARDEIAAHLRQAYGDRGRLVAGGNRPWDIAYTTGHRVVPLPPEPGDLERWRADGLTVDVALVPSELSFAGDGLRPTGWIWWASIHRSGLEVFGQYRLRHTFSDGTKLFARDESLPVPAEGDRSAYCAPDQPIQLDLTDGADVAFLGDDFHPRERGGDGHAYAWILGRRASATLIRCHRRPLRTLRVTSLSAAPANRARVVVGRTLVGTIAYQHAFEWQTATFDIPAVPLAGSTIQVRLEVDRGVVFPGAIVERSIALERIVLE